MNAANSLTEYLIEFYNDDNGDKPIVRRFVITKQCYDRQWHLMTGEISSQADFRLYCTDGSFAMVNGAMYTGFRLFTRSRNPNPLNDESVYDNPLN